jgi:hypothetical protein
VHVSETPELREMNDLSIALEAGFDSIVHGTYLDREDLFTIKRSKINMILCPRSNLWHGLKAPPLSDILEIGIDFALGTDNAGLVKPNIWREAEVALLLLRSAEMKGEEVARSILKSIFVNGYKSVHEKPRIISEGEEAHFLLFDGESSNYLYGYLSYLYGLARSSRLPDSISVDGSRKPQVKFEGKGRDFKAEISVPIFYTYLGFDGKVHTGVGALKFELEGQFVPERAGEYNPYGMTVKKMKVQYIEL